MGRFFLGGMENVEWRIEKSAFRRQKSEGEFGRQVAE